MTDNEIIKALEYCSKQGITSECEKCKVKKGCRSALIEIALDLINRQKAEIERLKNEVFAKEQECVDMQEQRDSVEYNLELIKQEKSVVIAEAIKEFAERLKIRFSGTLQCSGWLIQKVADDILEEMVGDNDAE